jgi:type I restriction enzyme R subunit
MTPPDEEPATPDDEGPIPPTPGEDETIVDQPGLPPPPGDPVRKIYVDGVGARIIAERVEYLAKNALRKRFASLDEFLKRWNGAERKQAIIEELEAEGLALHALADELGKNLDPFDLICHVAFDAKPLTRRERAEKVKKRDVFTKYGPQARAVLDALLEKYRDEGVLNLDDANVLKVTPFTDMGSVVQLINAFGGKGGFEKAVHEMQDALYQETA